MSSKKINLNVAIRNIVILIIAIAIILLIILVPNSGKFSPNVNSSRYKLEKNAEELKNVYEQEGNKEKFLQDISTIQNAVSMALLNDDVVDDKIMNKRLKEINKELKNNKWSNLDVDVPTFWVGSWSVDSTGTVKFKFLHEKSIPSWADDEDVIAHIVIN